MNAPARRLRSTLTDRAATAAFAVLVVAGDFEFRRRDVEQATRGSIDLATIGELLAYAVVGGWLLLTVARPIGRTPRPWLLQTLVALCLALAVSALWAPSPALATARAFQLLVSVGLVVAVAARARAGTWYAIAHGYVMVVNAGIAIGLVYQRPGDLQTTGRFMWLYGHPVVSASMLTVSALLLFGWWTDAGLPRRWSATTYGLLFGAHALALFATETRGSLLAFVAGLTVTLLARHRRRTRSDLILLGALATPPLIGLTFPLLKAIALRGETVGQLKSLNSRAGLWSEAWAAFSRRPLIGQGYFSSRELFLETIGLGGAHNAYIEIGLSAGLIGLTLFIAVLIGTVWRLRAGEPDAEKALLTGLFAAMLVNGLTAQYLAQAGTSADLLFLLVVAWVATNAGTPAAGTTASAAATGTTSTLVPRGARHAPNPPVNAA